jgi:hypothetical protein
MIHIEVLKVPTSGIRCDNSTCPHSPEYHDRIIGDNYFIKQDTTCFLIWLGDNISASSTEWYCRDCIDTVYQYIKSKLDSKLWAFH